jgi:hypothetical protein
MLLLQLLLSKALVCELSESSKRLACIQQYFLMKSVKARDRHQLPAQK